MFTKNSSCKNALAHNFILVGERNRLFLNVREKNPQVLNKKDPPEKFLKGLYLFKKQTIT